MFRLSLTSLLRSVAGKPELRRPRAGPRPRDGLPPSRRQVRLAEHCRRLLAEMFAPQSQAPLPSVLLEHVAIRSVHVSPDCRLLRVYWSERVDGTIVEAAERTLRRKGNAIRYQLTSSLSSLKYSPDIIFYYDNSAKIDEQLYTWQKTMESQLEDSVK
jgi:ribosome-binding factor A